MKKLKLNLTDLKVESFGTTSTKGLKGSIHGQKYSWIGDRTCNGMIDTCGYECETMDQVSCDHGCYTEHFCP